MTTRTARYNLGVVVTHPVQYFSPLFRRLADEMELTVYYAHKPTPDEQGREFGVAFEWDVDLTSGYRHVWLQNRAAVPDLSAFRGCDTPEIGGVLRAANHDAVLVAGWHSLTYWQAMWACWRSGTPVMVRGDSQLVGERGVARRMLKDALYPLFIRRFAACLSVGTRSAEYFQHYGARAVFRTPHFVDNEFFARRAAAVDRGAARARFGIADGATAILFAGKLTPKKRPMDIIDAVSRLGESRLHILFAGDGELRQQLADAVAQRGLRATFAGFMNQTELPEAYAAADVLVLPSDGRETWGLVVNEAMACGLPAIVSAACGCSPDLVSEGRTGYVYPCGDVSLLADRISRISANASAREEMGVAARRHVAEFSVDAAARGVVDAVRSVTGRIS